MQNQFNLFGILFKDNKEHSHSAVIKFLLNEDDSFFTSLLSSSKPQNAKEIKLEHKLDKHHRADLFIEGDDKVIIIENKFKCLPYYEQLTEYSKILEQKFERKTIEKYLLYFHKSCDFNIPTDWKPVTYLRLYEILEPYAETVTDPDKKLFLDHYLQSLNEYISIYKSIKNGEDLSRFFNSNTEDNGFWLNVIFHEISSIISKKYGYMTWVGNGNTYVPFINVHLPEWDYEVRNNIQYVIQLNGQKLKYYAHLDKITSNRTEAVLSEIKQLKEKGFETKNSGKYKIPSKKEIKTCFIYQENIIAEINQNSKTITIETLIEAILDLIKRVKATQN